MVNTRTTQPALEKIPASGILYRYSYRIPKITRYFFKNTGVPKNIGNTRQELNRIYIFSIYHRHFLVFPIYGLFSRDCFSSVSSYRRENLKRKFLFKTVVRKEKFLLVRYKGKEILLPNCSGRSPRSQDYEVVSQTRCLVSLTPSQQLFCPLFCTRILSWVCAMAL